MNRDRVVVGVDGSALSAAAVRAAAHVAAARGWSLHVLHAFATDLPMLGFGGGADRSVVIAHGQQLVQAGAATAHALHPDLQVTTSCHDGYASAAIIKASHTAEVVVVGAVGHGVLSRTSVGAVAMQVVTHAYSPVLVVGQEDPTAVATGGQVLVGIDESPESLRALWIAYSEAALRGATLEVLRVWQPRSATDPSLESGSSWEDYLAAFASRVDDALVTSRQARPGVEIKTSVLRGDPAHVLIEEAERATVVVVGSRGSGGFAGLHVGSTTMRLMGRTPCPLLVTR